MIVEPMDIFEKILVILLAIVVVIYLSGGHGMFGHSLGIPAAVVLIFLLIKGIKRKKNKN
jgi:uncharacterized membrane protein YjgN (DUF898 family)